MVRHAAPSFTPPPVPLTVRYRFRASSAAEARAHAEALLVEQTVETPPVVSQRYPYVREHLMGAVAQVDDLGGGVFRAHLVLPEGLARTDVAQLVNVVFGNASIHPGLVLDGLDLPEALLAGRGPRYGLAGIRARCGVASGPLVASALKPAGLSPEEIAALAYGFGLGGLDLVKDDHYLADHAFAPLEPRVRAVVDALDRAADATGRRTRYAPNLSGTPSEVFRQAEAAQRLGADAVMVAPMLVGLPTTAELAARHLSVPLLAHPSFSGMNVAPEVLLGQLFPLVGADAVIFAGYGGRFSVAPEACRALADRIRAPFDGMAGAMPVPAGGMTVERAAELTSFYGPDTMLLVGGSLLAADTPGDPTALADATRALRIAARPNAR